MKRPQGKLGFTLLELLIVVIIVGILAAIALPGFGKMVRRSRATEGQAVVGSILTAEFLYYQEQRKFTNSTADLLVDIPTSTNFTFGASGASDTLVTVTAAGTGGAAGITVEGTVSDKGQRTITTTGA